MQSNARDVTTYIQEAPAERQEVLVRLRAMCREHLPSLEETMDYMVPSYKRNGAVEVAFASQKYFIALYILRKPVMDAYREQLKGQSIGKGCIRYTKPEKVDFTIVKKLLSDTEKAEGPIS
ncbi:MAG: DUF1801 domain-containing protein [Chloroflexota bacterium]|nr:DUF1801 domain-containing protein [Chloroflexota bacterium]